jgi:hypothetical protein
MSKELKYQKSEAINTCSVNNRKDVIVFLE